MLNLPNLVTLLRLLLIPVVIINLLEGRLKLALLFFILAGLSDALDGFLARALNQKTFLGAVLDPIADKLLLNSVYLLGAYLELLPDWLAVIVLSRDILILIGFGILVFYTKRLEVHPTILSKCTTASQILTVVLTLGRFAEEILRASFLFTGGLTLASGFHYLWLGIKVLEKNVENQKGVP